MNLRIMGLAIIASIATSPSFAADKLKIGFINTFSGSRAIFGEHQKGGFEVALDHLGRKIGGLDTEIIYGDDQGKPDVGRQVATKMLKKDKVHFVVGITWSNVLAAVQKPVLRSKTFLISTNAGWSAMAGKNCNPYFFSTSWNNDQMPEAMGKLMRDEGISNVFLLSANYQAGKDMLTGFKRFYKGTIAGTILYRLGQSDYQAEISQIRAANPKAIFGFLPGGMGINFTKQYAAAGLSKNIPLYTVFTVDHMTLKGHGKNAVGTYHTNFWDIESKNPVNQRFIKDYIKKHDGKHPSSYAAQAYDAPLLIDSAVRAVKGNLKNKKGLIAAMEKADFKSVRGKFKFNFNHIPIQNFYKREVVTDESGKPKIVTRGIVFKDHADSYSKQCKMKRG